MSLDKKKLNILKKAITFKLIYKYMFPRKITTRLSMVIDKAQYMSID